MRVCMVVPAFPVISQTFVLHQITGLLNLGHDVRIISFGRPTEDVVHPEVVHYDLLARTHYLDVPTRRTSLLATGCVAFAELLAQHYLVLAAAARWRYGTEGYPQPYCGPLSQVVPRAIKASKIAYVPAPDYCLPWGHLEGTRRSATVRHCAWSALEEATLGARRRGPIA